MTSLCRCVCILHIGNSSKKTKLDCEAKDTEPEVDEVSIPDDVDIASQAKTEVRYRLQEFKLFFLLLGVRKGGILSQILKLS